VQFHFRSILSAGQPVVIGFRPRGRASIGRRIKRTPFALCCLPSPHVLIADAALLTYDHFVIRQERGRDVNNRERVRDERSQLVRVHKGTEMDPVQEDVRTAVRTRPIVVHPSVPRYKSRSTRVRMEELPRGGKIISRYFSVRPDTKNNVSRRTLTARCEMFL